MFLWFFFTSSFYFHLFSQQPSSTFSLNWISLINWSHLISHILNLKNNGKIWFPQHVELLQGSSVFAVFCLPHSPTRPLSAHISVFSSAESLEKTISNVVTSSPSSSTAAIKISSLIVGKHRCRTSITAALLWAALHAISVVSNHSWC